MAYLPSFEHDIFISYARVDDQKPPGKPKGWVTLLHEHLEFELSRLLGRIGIIKIWRDTREIDGSTFFDEAIQTSVESSGLFLALISPGYLSPECYCQRELAWFYRKAIGERAGLKIGNRSRLFSLLLYDIPPRELPEECAGTSGLKFHDAGEQDQTPRPSNDESELFRRQLRQLVDEVETTLESFKRVLEPEPKDSPQTDLTADSKSIFLAHTEGRLRNLSKRVVDELRRESVQVITDIPPPYDARAHERIVMAEMSKADLSVHLLDDAPGMEIEGSQGKSFLQKQVELGAQYAKSQLIWIPKTLDLHLVEDASHWRFLDKLENGNRERAKYSLIRESTNAIAREILAKVSQARIESDTPKPSDSAALLDTHFKDQLYALDLGKFLFEQMKVQPYIKPEGDSPQKNHAHFQEMLRQVSLLIIVFGQVATDWVRERLNCALQIATAERYKLKWCGIYLAPLNGDGTSRVVRLGGFPSSIPIDLFHRPEDLPALLNGIVKR